MPRRVLQRSVQLREQGSRQLGVQGETGGHAQDDRPEGELERRHVVRRQIFRYGRGRFLSWHGGLGDYGYD